MKESLKVHLSERRFRCKLPIFISSMKQGKVLMQRGKRVASSHGKLCESSNRFALLGKEAASPPEEKGRAGGVPSSQTPVGGAMSKTHKKNSARAAARGKAKSQKESPVIISLAPARANENALPPKENGGSLRCVVPDRKQDGFYNDPMVPDYLRGAFLDEITEITEITEPFPPLR